MSVRAEFWSNDVPEGRTNSDEITNEAELDRLVRSLRTGDVGDIALFTASHQLVAGSFRDGFGAVGVWGPNEAHFTEGDGPDEPSSFFQTDFPPNVRITMRALRDVLVEFLHTGARSNAVAWQRGSPAPEVSAAERAEFAAIFDSWPEPPTP